MTTAIRESNLKGKNPLSTFSDQTDAGPLLKLKHKPTYQYFYSNTVPSPNTFVEYYLSHPRWISFP